MLLPERVIPVFSFAIQYFEWKSSIRGAGENPKSSFPLNQIQHFLPQNTKFTLFTPIYGPNYPILFDKRAFNLVGSASAKPGKGV